MKRSIAPLTHDLVRLRLLEERDLPLTLGWRNQEHIRKWFVYSDVITPEGHRNWFERYIELDNDFVFVIEHDSKPVGQCALYRVDWTSRSAEFGRLMLGEPSAEGKGIAGLATQLVVGFGLRVFDLTRIYLSVFETNHRAISIYRRCGFVKTALQDGLLHMEVIKPAA